MNCSLFEEGCNVFSEGDARRSLEGLASLHQLGMHDRQVLGLRDCKLQEIYAHCVSERVLGDLVVLSKNFLPVQNPGFLGSTPTGGLCRVAISVVLCGIDPVDSRRGTRCGGLEFAIDLVTKRIDCEGSERLVSRLLEPIVLAGAHDQYPIVYKSRSK